MRAVVERPRQKSIVLILSRELSSKLATAANVTDERGELVYFNEAAEELLGRQFAETARQSQQPTLLSRFGRCLGLLGRRALGLPVLQGLGEGVRPPVRRYVRDHWRHLLSS